MFSPPSRPRRRRPATMMASHPTPREFPRKARRPGVIVSGMMRQVAESRERALPSLLAARPWRARIPGRVNQGPRPEGCGGASPADRRTEMPASLDFPERHEPKPCSDDLAPHPLGDCDHLGPLLRFRCREQEKRRRVDSRLWQALLRFARAVANRDWREAFPGGSSVSPRVRRPAARS